MMTRKEKNIVLVSAMLALGIVLGAWLMLAAANLAPWSCPQEDSCRSDYRHGRWYIERYDDPDGPQFYSHSRPADWPAMKIVAG
jgi:hypothetical protein